MASFAELGSDEQLLSGAGQTAAEFEYEPVLRPKPCTVSFAVGFELSSLFEHQCLLVLFNSSVLTC